MTCSSISLHDGRQLKTTSKPCLAIGRGTPMSDKAKAMARQVFLASRASTFLSVLMLRRQPLPHVLVSKVCEVNSRLQENREPEFRLP